MAVRHWRLDGGGRTLLLVAAGDALPEVVHWGAALPPGADPEALHAAAEPDVTGGMLDANPPLSICPEGSRSFPGTPGLLIPGLAPRFAFAGEGAGDGLALRYEDAVLGLTLTFRFALTDGLLTASTWLDATAPIRPTWLCAPVLPIPRHMDRLLDMAGHWTGEFRPVTTPLAPGARLRDNPTGRTGHEHPPLAYLFAPGTTDTGGEALAFHYGWSGGHRMLAERLPDGRGQMQWSHATGTLPKAATHRTADLLVAWSDAGLNGAAVQLQRHLRDRVARPALPRRVHYNGWEAVYFDHDLDTLRDIATRAARLGAERFVLDDGWFGRRDDDTTSLGDWQVDRRKWPNGLAPLIDHVHREGMDFGLWVEPEMVSPDSDLARAHPAWILGPEDQIPGRGQRVLDMGLEAVRDHLFDALDALLRDHAIAYLKWDHNRVLPMGDARQTEGTYALLDRLRAAHPHVEIETCASGGGRIDAGILRRCARVWLSDSNDALERLRIQHDAALLLPAAITGSHVGPRTCHTSGRVLPMHLRAWTAAQRQMGFEMDPRELTDAEAAELSRVTAWWKANRDWLMEADIHRVPSDPALIAEQHLTLGGDRFTAFAAQVATPEAITPAPLRLTALDPHATYRIQHLTRADLPALSRGTPALEAGPVDLPGAWLMAHGLPLPWAFPQFMHVLDGRRL